MFEFGKKESSLSFLEVCEYQIQLLCLVSCNDQKGVLDQKSFFVDLERGFFFWWHFWVFFFLICVKDEK